MMGWRAIGLGAVAAALAVVLWFDWFGAPAPSSTPPRIMSDISAATPSGARNDGGHAVAARSHALSGRQTEGPAAPSGTATAGASAPLSALLRLDRDQFADIIARPLFASTRRPPIPKPKPKAKPVVIKKPPPPRAPPLRAQLVGIVKGNGRLIALLREPGSNTTRKLSTGDTIQSWEIETIGDATVRVRHKKWTRDLTLFRP